MIRQFCIPTINLIHVNLTAYTTALCLGLNKGYIETDSLLEMLDLVEDLKKDEKIDLVGCIDKILIEDNIFVYRQRVYFIKLSDLLDFCNRQKMVVSITDNFYFTAKNLLKNQNEQKYLSYYAKQCHCDRYDEWLLHVFKVYLLYYLRLKGLTEFSIIDDDALEFIDTQRGCLDRAPFLLSVYDIERKNFVVFQQTDLEDNRLYTPQSGMTSNSILDYGFTTKNIIADKKKGLFKA